jgi:sterol 14alpha-demethylase
MPRDKSLPPEVFHVLPIIGSAIQYGEDPINFFFKCREKVGIVAIYPGSPTEPLLNH